MLALLFRERWPVQRSRSTDHRQQRLAHATSSLRERQALGALDTAVNFGGPNQAGIAYFVLKPQVTSGNVSATVAFQGITGLANNNLTYPAVGVTVAVDGLYFDFIERAAAREEEAPASSAEGRADGGIIEALPKWEVTHLLSGLRWNCIILDIGYTRGKRQSWTGRIQ